jgi:hypothetical protein
LRDSLLGTAFSSAFTAFAVGYDLSSQEPRSQGGDIWRVNNIDATFFLRDADFGAFLERWQAWAMQFGEMVLVYDPIGFPDTYWTIYRTGSFPVRVEFKFQPEKKDEMEAIALFLAGFVFFIMALQY